MQAQTRPRKTESGFGYFQVGYIGVDLTEFNEAVTGAGLPKLDDQFLTIGGGGFGERGRWLIGGEGHALIGKSRATSDGDFKLNLGGGYGLFRIGYKMVSKPNVNVYPMVGIGGGGVQFDIRGRSAPTFDEVLANPARSSRLSSAGFLLDVGAGAIYRIRLSPATDTIEGGVLVGVTAGYTFSPANSEWKLDELNSVAGGPSVKIEGFYVRLSLGGWGRKRE